MKYIYYFLALIAIILLVLLLVEIIKMSKKIKEISKKTEKISSGINDINKKCEYIEEVKNKTFLDEIALTILIFKDSLKNYKKDKKPSIAKSITKAYFKDTKNKSYKDLPRKIKNVI